MIDDQLTTDERAELHASLERALDDSDADAAWMWRSTYVGIELVVIIVRRPISEIR